MSSLDSEEIAWVDVRALNLADSPRLEGENQEHTRVLAELDAALPPIIVHRGSMRVIDGVHRLNAAILKGHQRVAVRFFDGSEGDAFLLGVRHNIAHGLPLSLADREAAAARVITTFPQWSDRAIAAAVGLSARTVRVVRQQVHGDSTAVPYRIGRDGKARPLSAAIGRLLASDLLARRPEAPLREVAKAAHISLATARDVRERVRRGEDPVPPSQRIAHRRHAGAGSDERGNPAEPVERAEPAEPDFRQELGSTLDGLRSDPSLRLTESGRTFLRWLTPRVLAPAGWPEVASQIPPHSGFIVARLVRRCAKEWVRFAEHLEQQGTGSSEDEVTRRDG